MIPPRIILAGVSRIRGPPSLRVERAALGLDDAIQQPQVGVEEAAVQGGGAGGGAEDDVEGGDVCVDLHAEVGVRAVAVEVGDDGGAAEADGGGVAEGAGEGGLDVAV